MAGCFIVVEGGEGTGKSTQVARLGERFRDFDRPHRVTREPGGTERGAQIRELFLHDHGDLDARAEVLLLAADRAHHVATLIRPALDAGEVVVSDRYTPSTLAYQGIGRGLGVAAVERISSWAAADLEPDLVIVLDLPDAVANARVDPAPDRVEGAGPEFHAAVREAYRTLAPIYDWTVIDATGTVDEVAERVWDAVRKVLP